MTGEDADGSRELQTFVVRLGAAMNAAGEPVYSVQQRLSTVARAYGARSARISAFPTSLMVTMGTGEPATLELTMGLATVPRLDQIAALDRLVQAAERAQIAPSDGIRTLDEIRVLQRRFGRVVSILGYSVLSVGLCLLLDSAPREVAAAAVFGALVGVLRTLGRGQSSMQILMPVVAAFSVAALSALAVKYDLTDPGIRAMVASLVVFLPGAALTTAVLELAAGQMVSGSSRLVSGAVQLALLAFGILAGIELVGISAPQVLGASNDLIGDWSPWLGVLVFAAGVTVANSAPAKSFLGLLAVLYAAWVGQVLGNEVFGGYVSAFVGAVVMTAAAFWVSRLPSAMPQHASFLPGFWLLVPGALGLIGLAEFAGDPTAAGTQDIVATVVSLFAIAVGVLCGTLLLASADWTGRVVSDGARTVIRQRHPWGWLSRFRKRGHAGTAERHDPPAS
ncbi:MAG: threonine/serine exporter family protein [Ilumatobacteraceae bacterium]